MSSLRDVGLSRTDQAVLSKHMAHSLHTADTQYDESRQFDARLICLTETQATQKQRERMSFYGDSLD